LEILGLAARMLTFSFLTVALLLRDERVFLDLSDTFFAGFPLEIFLLRDATTGFVSLLAGFLRAAFAFMPKFDPNGPIPYWTL
jgi:hypothetical protein